MYSSKKDNYDLFLVQLIEVLNHYIFLSIVNKLRDDIALSVLLVFVGFRTYIFQQAKAQKDNTKHKVSI